MNYLKRVKIIAIILMCLASLSSLFVLCSSHKYHISIENLSLQELDVSINVDDKNIVDTLIHERSVLNNFSFTTGCGFKNFKLKINGRDYEESVLVLKNQSAMVYIGQNRQAPEEFTYHFSNYYGSVYYCPSPLPFFPDSTENNSPDTVFFENGGFITFNPNDST